MVVLLKSYIESKYCRGGSKKINMIDEIKRQVRSLPGKPVIIAVDLPSSVYSLPATAPEVLSGGRQLLYRDRIRQLFGGLVEAGATLVFFGKDPPKTSLKWPAHANKKYNSYQHVFEANNASKEVDWNKVEVGRSLYNDTYLKTTREFGHIHIPLKSDHKLVTANYASEVKAFAVITDHTDYLLFPGNWRIWRIMCSIPESFTATEYNKKKLCSSLMLSQKQLPIFATLGGNRFMPLACVKHIKSRLSKQGGLMKGLSELVRRLCPDGTPLSETSKNALIELICRDHKTTFSDEEVSKFLDDSINSYCCPSASIEPIEPFELKNYALQEQSKITFCIRQNLPFAVAQFYIDSRQPNVKQFWELVLPIFQRQIGIILRDADDNHSQVVIYKPSHDEPFQEKTVKIIKPAIVLPSIEDVVNNPKVEFSTKLDMLAEILFPGNEGLRKKLDDLDIKDANFVPILKICYLKKNNQITTEEADVLLLSIHESCKMDDKHRQMYEAPKIFDPKAFWIAMTYNNISFYFYDSLALSGLHNFITVDTFDGYIFHKLYAKFFQYNNDQRNKLLECVKNLRIYVC